MIDAQKNDVKLQQRLQLVRNGDKSDYYIEEDGEVCFIRTYYVYRMSRK